MAAITRLAAVMGIASIAVVGAGMLVGNAPMTLLLLLPSLALLLFSVRSGPRWSSSAWLIVQIGIAAGAGTPAPLAILATALGLGYWDLEDFGRRLASAENVLRYGQLVRRHLRLLAVALAIGCLLAILASAGEFQIGFLAAVVSTVVFALAMGYLLRSSPADEVP